MKEDIHKYVSHFPFPCQSMLDTPGKRQNTLVSLNIVRGEGVTKIQCGPPKCSNTFFPRLSLRSEGDSQFPYKFPYMFSLCVFILTINKRGKQEFILNMA